VKLGPRLPADRAASCGSGRGLRPPQLRAAVPARQARPYLLELFKITVIVILVSANLGYRGSDQ